MKTSRKKKAPQASSTLRKRLRIAVAIVVALVPLSVIALWIGIHKTTWLGPLLADTARSAVGPDAVARLEEFAYGLQDRWNQWRHKDDQPVAYWEVPEAPAPAAASSAAGVPEVPHFVLADVGPAHSAWSAPGDGVWVGVPDERHPADPPRLLKTLIHPDRGRSWTAVSVVAVDLQQVELHAVAGKHEPKAVEAEAAGYKRTGLIPDEDRELLVAAFNGGFKYEHGNYGMRVDGITLARPRPKMCTIVGNADRSVTIGTWQKIADASALAPWWRQTPYCMVEGGEIHPGLKDPDATLWGCTLEGETVIRRSAMGISQDGKVLYVAIGDDTTARAMAVAMKHAGAYVVAQLDVNYSYPRFLVYAPKGEGDGALIAKPICKGFEYKVDDYIGSYSPRDFFYLTRRAETEKTAER